MRNLKRFIRAWVLVIAGGSGLLATGCGAQVVTLSGTGVAPKVPGLTLNSSSIAFGDVDTGASATQSLTMTSTGTAPVTVSAVTVLGQPPFSVVGPTLPIVLQPQSIAQTQVTFSPTADGTFTGAVTVVSNALTSPVQSVALTGVAQTVSVVLTWNAAVSPADPVVGYRVYRAQAGTGIYVALNSTPLTALTFTDSTIVAGQSYDYIAESVDAAGVTSLPSNVFTAVIP